MVGKMFLPEVIPKIFDRVELRTVGRQEQQVHGWWHAQGSGSMPAGAIQHHQNLVVGIFGCDLREEDAHGVGIDPIGDQRGELPVVRRDGGEGVEVLSDMLGIDDRAHGCGCPAAAWITDATKAGLVLEEEPQGPPQQISAFGVGIDVFGEFF